MLYNVKMRVWSGPRAFDDVTVQVDAESGDDAVSQAAAKAGGKKHAINTVMPVSQEELKEAAKKAPKKGAKK